ncbi:hypothetical protein [Amycolatopsis pigmentata]|uniref:Uncharacterized protein n=1 Tax=Amycolatopsis pigmentata TaxID=450801 RepID=A0ABW5FVL3_9PSEU
MADDAAVVFLVEPVRDVPPVPLAPARAKARCRRALTVGRDGSRSGLNRKEKYDNSAISMVTVACANTSPNALSTDFATPPEAVKCGLSVVGMVV